MGGLVLLALVLFLALLMWGATWGMNVAMKRMIGAKHQALQTIVETGQVPAEWRAPFERRIARLGQRPDRGAQVARIERAASESYLKRLDSLTQYVRTSTLVDGDDTRQMLLDKLMGVVCCYKSGSPFSETADQK